MSVLAARRQFRQSIPYWGPVCSRLRLPSEVLNASITNSMSRLFDYCRGGMGWVRVCVGNIYLDVAGDEAGSGNSYTAAYSVEYNGTVYRATFGGALTATVASGTRVWSDPFWAPVPDAGQFWHRYYVTAGGSSGNYVYTDGAANNMTILDESNTAYDSFEVGTSDKTGSTGALTQNGYNNWIGPLALVGLTRLPTWGIIGDSREQGVTDTAEFVNSSVNYYGLCGQSARSLGQYFGVLNYGRSGRRAYDDNPANGAALAIQRELLMMCSHIVTDIGGADVILGTRTDTQAWADMQAVYKSFPGKQVFANTILPYTNSSNGWVSPDDQTFTGGSTIETYRQNLNANLRGSLDGTGLAGIFDPAAILENAAHHWIVTTGAPFTGAIGTDPGGLHPLVAGYKKILSSNVIDPWRFPRGWRG